MKLSYLRTSLLLSSLLGGLMELGAIATAQVISDTTLGLENSVVNPAAANGATTYTITGGSPRGRNLFHSFEQFSLGAGDAAIFDQANTNANANIANIIGRVTGSTVSSLNGRVQADANLFLINPTGIIIGPDAELAIGGSFLATTGQGLRFENGFVYGVASPEVPPLLTISVPTGILMGSAPNAINIVGSGDSTQTGLAVNAGQTLAFIGGDISLTGAKLGTAGGTLALGSVNQAGEVRIASLGELGVNLDGIDRFGKINIMGQSVIDVSGLAGGTVNLHGEQITLAGRSAIISDTWGNRDGGPIQLVADRVRLRDGSFMGTSTVGAGTAGNIDITATQEIMLVGTDVANFKFLQFVNLIGLRQISDRQRGGLFTNTTATGDGGNIRLTTQRLVLDKGVLLSTESLGTGNSGDIDITATDRVTLVGSGVYANSLVPGIPLVNFNGVPTGLTTTGVPAGDGGNVTVNTIRLVLDNGAAIAAGTVSDAASGNVVIKATDAVELRGFYAPLPIPTTITTSTVGGTGTAGDVQIETGRLLIQDGSKIFTTSGSVAFSGGIPFGGRVGDIRIVASESVDIVGSQRADTPADDGFVISALEAETLSDFPAGAISVTTPSLTLRDGGRITSATLGRNQGGPIDIRAGSVSLVGTSGINGEIASGIFSNAGSTAAFLLFNELGFPITLGDGGRLDIQVDDTLLVQDGAQISVGSSGLGKAGDLEISAHRVRLDNRGGLLATTTSGQGGNITLNVEQLLQLRRQSQISATAGGIGAGGNITFNGGIILAVLDENSDIIANAFEGPGGRVLLTARDILGFELSNGQTLAELRSNRTNDISASSAFGTPGEIQILNSIIDPDQGLAELPTNPLRGEQLGQSVCAPGDAGKFVVTGRGGVPLSPQDVLGNSVVWDDERDHWAQALAGLVDRSPVQSQIDLSASPPIPVLVEAQAIQQLADGTITLVASAATSHSPLSPPHSLPQSDCGPLHSEPL